ncbi:MAG: hypothetical protein AAFR47_22615 [Pseudomonadota bacterium]
MKGKVSVYRHYDADGALLYVGMCDKVPGRQMGHLGSSPWVRQIARITIDLYPDRVSAHVAERAAIAIEKPRHNSPSPPVNDAERAELQQRKGRSLGRAPKYPFPTSEQAQQIQDLWYSGMKLALLTKEVQAMLGAPVPKSWVRDQMVKWTGSGARKRPQPKSEDSE